MSVVIECVQGADIERHLPALAQLRIEVFREFPYLYVGSLDYERTYLVNYASSPAALVVIARDADRIIGTSTAMPLTTHSDDVVPARGCYLADQRAGHQIEP